MPRMLFPPPLPSVQSDEAVKELARDLFGGQVLGDWNVPHADMAMVFMPVTLGAIDRFLMWPSLIRQIAVFGVVGKDTTSGMYCNGYPTFFGCRVWRRSDVQRAAQIAQRMQEMLDASL